MAGSRTAVWAPILVVGILITAGLVISAAVVLSLIPIYINSRAVDSSATTELVHTVDDLDFDIGGSSGRQLRFVRDTSLPAPSAAMISSISTQCNSLFSEVGGTVIVFQARLISIRVLRLTLKIFFRPACPVCRNAQRRLIKRILKKKLKFNIFFEYSTDCSLDPIVVGFVPIQLSGGSGSGSGNSGENNDLDSRISGPVRTSVALLVQQVDVCGSRGELQFPSESECRRTENNGIVTAMILSNDTDRNYCFFFVTTRTMSKIELQFIFSSAYQDGYFGLDNVTLTSNRNLILNGNFDEMGGNQTMNSTNSTDPWIISQCAQTCSVDVNYSATVNLPQSFICSGVGIILRQIINLNTIGRRAVYRLGFSLGYESTSGAPGSLIVMLTST